MLMRVCSLPFIIRHTNSNNSTEALSLIAATWSLSTIISGLVISGTSWINNIFFVDVNYLDERKVLLIITFIGLSGIYFSLKIDEKKLLDTKKSNFLNIHKNYDWNLIFKAISPLILISIGAGLTIPFVNLFFNSVFNLSSSQFSMMGSLTGILVFIFSLSVPLLRKKFGYWMTIVIVQSIAILCLVLMALTEIYADYEFALLVAILAYVLRQPLMHMAHPASNELMMNYVGKKNQELISALSSSLWSASWFFSAKIFEWLRLLNYNYYKIFLITALLYTIGVVLFSILIRDFNKRIINHEIKIS
jgi:predicted MFS family arabinose efflux permease